MKIAFFVNDFPSYSQTFVIRQIAGAIEGDCAVSVFARRPGTAGSTHRLIGRHAMMDRTVYLPAVPRTFARRLLGIVRYCSREGRPAAIVRLARALNIMAYGREAASLKLAWQCLPFLNHGRYDILHCQFGMLGEAVVKLRQTGALKGKLVTAFRGYDTSPHLKQNPGAYDRLFRHGDLFLPVCEHFKRWLIANGCPEDKIVVLRSGIDPDDFAFAARKPQENRPVRLLSVGRLVEKKGLRYALTAVAGIKRSGKKIEYLILGEGPLRKELEQQSAEMGIGDIVTMPGNQPHAQIVAQMENSDILLAPSITAEDGDQEGIPNVIKEAMASGMPVISTRHAGIPELVVDGQSGFLTRERDAEGLEKCLNVLLESPGIWPELGAAGRLKVEKEYDIRHLNRQLLELYAALIPAGDSGRAPAS